MAVKKRKNQKRNKSARKEMTIDPMIKDKTLPDNHRYDDEIANKTSAILIKSELARIDNISSVEKCIRQELVKIVNQKNMSRVATMYFSAILDMTKKNPFSKIGTETLRTTYDEYLMFLRHMKKFDGIPMKNRLLHFFEELKNNSWKMDFSFSQKDKDIKSNTLSLEENWENLFNNEYELDSPLRIYFSTNNLSLFTEIAFQSGVQLFKDKSIGNKYHMILFPKNNIPALPLIPESFTANKKAESAK